MAIKVSDKISYRLRSSLSSRSRFVALKKLKGSLKRHSKRKLEREMAHMRREWD